MAQDEDAPRRRLDHVLYASEGVGVLGTAIFLIGFVIESRSHTPGRALEAAGFVVFGIGLFASAAAAHFLARHYADTLSEADEPLLTRPLDTLVPPVGDLITEEDEGDLDPTSSLEPEVGGSEVEELEVDESEVDAAEEQSEELAHPDEEQPERENSSD